MKRFAALVSSNSVVQAVLAILFGLFLALWPQTTVLTVVYLLAAYLGITGIVSLISYARHRNEPKGSPSVLAAGILLVVSAIIIFAIPETIAGFFSIVLGAVLILSGVTNGVRTLELRKYGGSAWIVLMIASVALVAGGIAIIVNPFDSTVTFVLVLGILLVAKGVIDLAMQASLSRKIQERV